MILVSVLRGKQRQRPYAAQNLLNNVDGLKRQLLASPAG